MDEKLNSFEEVINYNNFYEFGIGKIDLVQYFGSFKILFWLIRIDGMVDCFGSYGVEDLVLDVVLEECIYCLCCVEVWLMVILWLGVLFFSVLNKVGVQLGVKYVVFQILLDFEQMLGQCYCSIDWFYCEGLWLDEVMYLLVMLVIGFYGKVLFNQNGVLIWLVVLWKYGFKLIKLIILIMLIDKQLLMSWQMLQVNEYGFYVNVNLQVDYLCWLQVIEWWIGVGLFGGWQEMLMFNGYGDQVVNFYVGMDLKKFY